MAVACMFVFLVYAHGLNNVYVYYCIVLSQDVQCLFPVYFKSLKRISYME